MTLRLGDTVKFLDFTGLAQFVAKHKRAARLVAAPESKKRFGAIKRSMFSQAAEKPASNLKRSAESSFPKPGMGSAAWSCLTIGATTALKAGPKPAFVATSRRPI